MPVKFLEEWHQRNLPCGCVIANRRQPYQNDGLPSFVYKYICNECQESIDAVLQEIQARDSKLGMRHPKES